MITLQQHLTESLSSGYPFVIDNIDGDGISIEYQMSFKGKNSDYYVMVMAHLKGKRIRIDFSDDEGSNDITGAAGTDALKVFATLGNILQRALIQHPGFAVQFEGSNAEPSKVKLYKALADKIAKILGGSVKTSQHLANTRFTITPPRVSPNR